jgi:hypothetical protein
MRSFIICTLAPYIIINIDEMLRWARHLAGIGAHKVLIEKT